MTEAEREAYIRYLNDKYDLLIYKVAYGILKDEYLAEDVKQQVLIKLTPKVEVLQTLHPRQVAAYVGTTTKNIAITEYNKQISYESNKEKVIENYTKTMTMDHVEFKAFEGKYGFGEDLWNLLLELPARDREIMVYRFYYGMSSAEIAEEIGTNREQVKKNFQRTRQKLIKLIEERGVELR